MFAETNWFAVRDGDPRAISLYLRHYSADKSRGNERRARPGADERFLGPGEHMVLLTPACDALFAWRLQQFRQDGQHGVECAVFRNESPRCSSELIVEAMQLALQRWGAQRLFTFVNPGRIRSTNPGYCFLQAGWRRLDGSSRRRRLRLLEYQF